MSIFSISKYLLCFLFILQLPSTGQGQQVVDPQLRDEVQNLAAVQIDGIDLFYIRGVMSYPAKLRAETIENRIYAIAGNYSINPKLVTSVNEEGRIKISVDGEFVLAVFDADGEVEGVPKEVFAELISEQLTQAIQKYRYQRSAPAIKTSLLKAFIALCILVIVLWVFNFLFKRLNNWFKRRIESKVQKIEDASFKLIQSDKLLQGFHLLYNVLRISIIVFISVGFLNYFLGLFPWTKGLSVIIIRAILDPLESFGNGLIQELPNFIVLTLIWFVTKYLLKFIRLVFLEVGREAIHLKGFDAEWAMPTFRIVRLLIIVFALVVAFPYIPGSDTNAFKGISVFLGIIFSLGSSSFIANIVAGYSMTYQGAFKHGDFIKVNEFEGFVESQTSMVTRLRSRKNEEIVIPNSVMLSSNVINYSMKAKKHDLIIYTTVGIGYETPWRQVDAMLKLAANRTEGLMKEPEPFVLKKALGDFAITYEINAYCLDETKLPQYYSLLHQHILDVFNENEVAIMTPAYMADPATAKVVAKDQWDIPLVKKE